MYTHTHTHTHTHTRTHTLTVQEQEKHVEAVRSRVHTLVHDISQAHELEGELRVWQLKFARLEEENAVLSPVQSFPHKELYYIIYTCKKLAKKTLTHALICVVISEEILLHCCIVLQRAAACCSALQPVVISVEILVWCTCSPRDSCVQYFLA